MAATARSEPGWQAYPSRDGEPKEEAAHRNEVALERWLAYVAALTAARVVTLTNSDATGEIPAPPPLPGRSDEAHFPKLVREYGLSPVETTLFVIAAVPLLRPDLFDRAVAGAGAGGFELEALGGTRGRQHRGMMPTGDTALCLLAGPEIGARLTWQGYLLGEGRLMREGLLRLDPPEAGEPPMSGRLMLAPDTAELLLAGHHLVPQLSSQFPARPLETALSWRDLVLPTTTLRQVEELMAWTRYSRRLLDEWGLRAQLRPGCRALFIGPPGTGKTLTAALIGQACEQPVLRIDLAMVVSKYIGETEKNLAAIFDKAERKGWLLFFDEADSLFGKRSSVKEARDRYANQEISFLLQRIEIFDGLAILASNLDGNVDQAFARRFEHVISFPMPRADERLALWRKALPASVPLEPGYRLAVLAERAELSGGSIINAVRHAALRAAMRDEEAVLRGADLEEGVRRELAKDGRSL
ncbi:ATP-binding protein [Marimonas arenosa]|uniref:ATP-binding protein n=1 Tax=Marimonas arenosa TaxID=1795305 RepID=A0AAE3W9K3_9RHOB|nr:ATP-binding protein [Marimonas arenosa]MDQ2088734.1 ATP-binding protein [Marimonas arenosa]